MNASYIFLNSKDHMGSNKDCVSPSNIVSLVLAVPLDRLLANPASSTTICKAIQHERLRAEGWPLRLIATTKGFSTKTPVWFSSEGLPIFFVPACSQGQNRWLFSCERPEPVSHRLVLQKRQSAIVSLGHDIGCNFFCFWTCSGSRLAHAAWSLGGGLGWFGSGFSVNGIVIFCDFLARHTSGSCSTADNVTIKKYSMASPCA